PSGTPWPWMGLAARVAVERLQVASLTLGDGQPSQSATLTLDGFVRPSGAGPDSRQRIHLAAREISQPGLALDLDGTAPLATPLAMELQLTVRDAAGRLGRFLDHPVLGPLTLTLEGRGDPTAWQGRLVATAPRLAVVAAAIRLQKAGEELTIDGQATADLPDLTRFQPPRHPPRLTGSATARLTLSGDPMNPDLEATITLGRPAIEGRRFDRGTVALQARNPAGAPAGTLQATLVSGPDRLRLTTPWRTDPEGRIHLDPAALQFPGGQLQGPLVLQPATGQIRGRIGGRSIQLAALSRLLGMASNGVLAVDLGLTPGAAPGAQGVEVAIEGRDLAVPGVVVGSLALRGSVADVTAATPSLGLQAHLEEVSAGELQLATARVAANGPLATGLDLTAEGRGSYRRPFAVQARAGVRWRQETLAVTLQGLDGHLDGRPLGLDGTPGLILGPDRMALTPLALHWGDATLRAVADLAGQRLTGSLHLDLPLTDPWPGHLGLAANLDGSAAKPVLQADLTIDRLRWAAAGLDQTATGQVSAHADWRDGRVTATGTLAGPGDATARFTAALPLAFSAHPFLIGAPSWRELTAQLQASARLESLAALWPLDQQQLTGRVRADLRLTGASPAPGLRGTLTFDGIDYEHGVYGLVLRNGRMDWQARGDRLALTDLEFTDGEKGRISGSGRLELQQGLPWTLALGLADATLLRRDDLTAQLSGRLALTGTREQAALRGALTTRRVEYFLPEAFRTGIDRIAVRDARPSRGITAAPDSGPERAFRTDLDVDILLPGQVFVRGKGLDSEWRGQLRIAGQAEDPTVAGQLTVQRGQLQTLGKRFNLTDSVLRFEGPVSPRFDIRAVLKQPVLETLVRLKGPPEALQMELSSQPALPPDEILSRLLFDKAAFQATPLQALRLASAVKTLRDGGPGIMDRVTRSLGLDSLELDGEGLDSGAARLGKYLGDSTYVNVERGLKAGSGKVAITHELLPNVVLETKAGEDASGSLGIRWKKDY
nr:translocation/assembly module TamB domain-containing protein [Magnetococcales bacterium]